VSVVNEYAATSDFVFVTLERKVDLPYALLIIHPGHLIFKARTTEGKPTSDIRASPLLLTSNPDPPPLPDPGAGSKSCARSLASFL
jgi:hypothetical protein